MKKKKNIIFMMKNKSRWFFPFIFLWLVKIFWWHRIDQRREKLMNIFLQIINRNIILFFFHLYLLWMDRLPTVRHVINFGHGDIEKWNIWYNLRFHQMLQMRGNNLGGTIKRCEWFLQYLVLVLLAFASRL